QAVLGIQIRGHIARGEVRTIAEGLLRVDHEQTGAHGQAPNVGSAFCAGFTVYAAAIRTRTDQFRTSLCVGPRMLGATRALYVGIYSDTFLGRIKIRPTWT